MHTIRQGTISTFEDSIVASQYAIHTKARETLAYQVARSLVRAIERENGASVIASTCPYYTRVVNKRFRRLLVDGYGFTLEEINARCNSKGFDFKFLIMEEHPSFEGAIKIKDLAEVLIELANEREAGIKGSE